MLANSICSSIGLDIHKPALTKHIPKTSPNPSLSTIVITCNDILQWAEILPGTFNNYKTTISTAEALRMQLGMCYDFLTCIQLDLGRHLDLLAGIDADQST
jgi:hypothetical protein